MPDKPPPEERGGQERIALTAASTVAMVAGTVWFFEGGTRFGAGDPAALIMGAAFVGVTGAAAGGLAAVLSDSEAAIADPLGQPWVSLDMSSFGTSTLGEARPPSGSVRLSPRLLLGPHAVLTPSARLFAQVGPRIDVDPRGEPREALEPVLSTTRRGFDLAMDLRLVVSDGARIEPIARPVLQVRSERIDYLALGSERRMRRAALVPLALGALWHLSERQHLALATGPQLDLTAWADDAGEWTSAPWYLGALWLDVRYDIDVPHAKPVFGMSASSRFRIDYTSSQFDGLGVDTGAVIGYIGPLILSWDTTLRPSGERWALWMRRPRERWSVWGGLSATLAEGGRAMLTLGVVPPMEER